MQHSHPFMIAGRFIVDPSLNLVTDQTSKKGTRLEARIMQILCLLAENNQNLVPRELLVKMIWDNYGGGDDGLTQSISVLRKVLDDSGKALITTLSKKGYILNAEVTPVTPKISVARKWLTVSGLIATLILFLLLLFHIYAPKSAALFSTISTEAAETITTTSPDGTIYKLVGNGEGRPFFFINNKLLSPPEMEKYNLLIRQLHAQLIKREKGR